MKKKSRQSNSVSKSIILKIRKYTNNYTSKADAQVSAIVSEAIAKTPNMDVKSTRCSEKQVLRNPNANYVYRSTITAIYSPAVGETEESIQFRMYRFATIVNGLVGAKNRNWEIYEVVLDDEIVNLEEAVNVDIYEDVPTAYAVLPTNWKPYFKHIFGLDPQIRLVIDPIKSFIASGYRRKNHICMYGQPGCGKTTVIETLYEIINEHSPPGACLKFTATQMTKAGLEKELIECDPKPSIIFIEEIEKAVEENCSALLDVFNTFGAVRKTDARRGNVHRSINALGICTINDVPRFKRMLAGALASRFAHKIFFPRPEQKVLKNIGLKDVMEIKGDPKYVDKALEIMDNENSNDPRRLKALLDGGERLLSGEFQKDQETMMNQLREENKIMRQLRANQEKFLSDYDLSE